MNERAKHILYSITNAFMIAGIVILFIGIYYAVIKASIPYQDPPLELQIQYAINAGIGDVLTGCGFKITIFSGIVRFVLHLIWKMHHHNSV